MFCKPEGIQRIRQQTAQYLGDRARQLDTEITERRHRLQRTELKIRGLDEDGPYADCELGAHILLSDFGARNRRIPGSGSSSRDSQVFASSSGGRI